MSEVLGRADLERFRAAVGRRLGLRFEDGMLGHLAEVLRERIQRSGQGRAGPYLARLASPIDRHGEWSALAEQLTVTETYFFRYWDHFRAFAELVLPECLRPQGARREVRILSAGCASGEEAYSLALLARDRLRSGSGPCQVKITGIDINPAMVQRAVRGCYPAWSLRETPGEFRQRDFRLEGRDYLLDPAVRAMAAFEERNLLEDDPAFWQPGCLDVVFCRNVLMYLLPGAGRTVVERLARALRPGGYLFLGHAENLRGVSDGFHLRHTHETFYYQRKEGHEPGSPPETAEPALSAAPSRAAALEQSASWVDAIRGASERIAVLAGGAMKGARARAPLDRAPMNRDQQETLLPAGAPESKQPWELGTAVELLKKERFGAALELLRALPPGSEEDPDVLLLRAVVLTNSGELAGAEETCRRILDLDELNAGAHYLMALCREHRGDRRAASDHDQTAAYLDPAFAMPRLHLGLLARQAGQRESARRELSQALVLLQQEDASRILLFGGGFSREALVELCGRELLSCGGTA